MRDVLLRSPHTRVIAARQIGTTSSHKRPHMSRQQNLCQVLHNRADSHPIPHTSLSFAVRAPNVLAVHPTDGTLPAATAVLWCQVLGKGLSPRGSPPERRSRKAQSAPSHHVRQRCDIPAEVQQRVSHACKVLSRVLAAQVSFNLSKCKAGDALRAQGTSGRLNNRPVCFGQAQSGGAGPPRTKTPTSKCSAPKSLSAAPKASASSPLPAIRRAGTACSTASPLPQPVTGCLSHPQERRRALFEPGSSL